jgi:hypothetical protein
MLMVLIADWTPIFAPATFKNSVSEMLGKMIPRPNSPNKSSNLIIRHFVGRELYYQEKPSVSYGSHRHSLRS